MSDPKNRGEWKVVADPAAVAAATAEVFAETVREAAQARGRAFVALAGGTTPRAANEKLASPELRGRVPWGSIEFFFGDERGVPPGHPDRNDRMASETLLSKVGVAPARIHSMPAHREDREAAADEYAAEIRAAVPAGPDGVPCFDLVLLGLGADGHTATLFPGTPALAEGARLVVPNYRPEGRWGMTFTFPLLDAARTLVVAATGAAKGDAVRQIREPGRAPLPAARLRPSGRLLWIVDQALARAAHLHLD